MELMYQGRAGGFLKKNKKQTYGREAEEGKNSFTKESLSVQYNTKEIPWEINRRKIRSYKTGDKTELEVKEAEQEYNLQGQLIKYVASTEPTPINTAQYEQNHSLITTSHPLYGTIYHSSSGRPWQFHFLHTRMDWPHSELLVPFHATTKVAGLLHRQQHHPLVEFTRDLGQQIWGRG